MTFNIPCQGCGGCCRWPGDVQLDDAEIARLAAFYGMTEPDFIEQHTRLRQDRRGLALQQREDGSCACFVNSRCVVNAVKPRQCRDFPSQWVKLLWSRMPVDQMKRDYPMLFACPAFQEFCGKTGYRRPEP